MNCINLILFGVRDVPQNFGFLDLKEYFWKKITFCLFYCRRELFSIHFKQKVQTGVSDKVKGKDSKKTIFECERWVKSRRESFLELGNLTKENLVYAMLEGAEQ